MSYRFYIASFAEFPAVLLLFRSGWGWVAGEVGNKTNLSPARASLLGLSLATKCIDFHRSLDKRESVLTALDHGYLPGSRGHFLLGKKFRTNILQ